MIIALFEVFATQVFQKIKIYWQFWFHSCVKFQHYHKFIELLCFFYQIFQSLNGLYKDEWKKDTHCPKYPKSIPYRSFLNLISVQFIFEYEERAKYWAPGLYCKSTVVTNCNLLDDVSFRYFSSVNIFLAFFTFCPEFDK